MFGGLEDSTVEDSTALVVPAADKSLDMQPSDNSRALPIPKCTERGHVMTESTSTAGDYKHGWICRRCDEWFAPGQSERWHCAQCSEDLCFIH